MLTRSHRKDVQQTKSTKKWRDTRDDMPDQKQPQVQKVQEDDSDINEKVFHEEKKIMAASVAAILTTLDDDRHEVKKSKKERRKSGPKGEPNYDIKADHGTGKEKKKGRDTPVLVNDSTVNPPKSDEDKDVAGDARLLSSANKHDKTKKGSRKRKHADPDEASASASLSNPVNEDQQPPKRHKKSKIVNPEKDESLSEQALKALAYAYSQYRHPEKWKFNKARQNWITRNVWSANMIPDQHLPLVTWYLKSVKGGVRDALIDKCRSQAQLPSQPESENKTTATEPVPPAPLFGLTPETLGKSPENAEEIKRSRAQILLEALQVL